MFWKLSEKFFHLNVFMSGNESHLTLVSIPIFSEKIIWHNIFCKKSVFFFSPGTILLTTQSGRIVCFFQCPCKYNEKGVRCASWEKWSKLGRRYKAKDSQIEQQTSVNIFSCCYVLQLNHLNETNREKLVTKLDYLSESGKLNEIIEGSWERWAQKSLEWRTNEKI